MLENLAVLKRFCTDHGVRPKSGLQENYPKLLSCILRSGGGMSGGLGLSYHLGPYMERLIHPTSSHPDTFHSSSKLFNSLLENLWKVWPFHRFKWNKPSSSQADDICMLHDISTDQTILVILNFQTVYKQNEHIPTRNPWRQEQVLYSYRSIARVQV